MSPVLKRILIVTTLLIVGLMCVPFFLTEKNGTTPPAVDTLKQVRAIRILFSGTEATAEDLGNFPGAIKRQRDPSKQNSFYYALTTPAGDLLAEGAFQDPRILYYDTPVDKTGKLEGGSIIQDETVFDIRLPKVGTRATLTLTDYTQTAEGNIILQFPVEPL